MVVTYHKSDDYTDMAHAQWKDWINIEDVCVLWGPNVLGNNYKKVEFSSMDWTCFFETKDMDAYKAFNLYAISNNHMLTADDNIAKAIKSARRGDQVHFTGYLVNYSN